MIVSILLDNDFTIDNRVRRAVETLAAHGYEVHLYALKSRDSKVPEETISGGVYIHRILEPGDFEYHLPRRWLHGLNKVLTLLKKYPKPGIVHANDVYTLPLAWLYAAMSRARLVYDSHEYWQATLLSNREKASAQFRKERHKKHLRQVKRCDTLLKLEPWLVRQCDAVMTVSDSIAEVLNRKRKPVQSCPVVIRNVPPYMRDSERMAGEKRYHQVFNLPPDTKVVLYQGVVKSSRGLEPMVKAIGRCREEKAVFVMMGPLNKPSYLEALMATAVPGTVFFKEAVSPAEIEEWTASADIGIVGSPRLHDNFVFSLPNKFFSYIQSGVPILTNDLPEMVHLLSNYRIGRMTDMEDETAIAAALKQMLRPGELDAFKLNIGVAKQELCWEKEQVGLIQAYAALAR